MGVLSDQVNRQYLLVPAFASMSVVSFVFVLAPAAVMALLG